MQALAVADITTKTIAACGHPVSMRLQDALKSGTLSRLYTSLQALEAIAPMPPGNNRPMPHHQPRKKRRATAFRHCDCGVAVTAGERSEAIHNSEPWAAKVFPSQIHRLLPMSFGVGVPDGSLISAASAKPKETRLINPSASPFMDRMTQGPNCIVG